VKYPVAIHKVRTVNSNYKIFATDCPYLSNSNQTKVFSRPSYCAICRKETRNRCSCFQSGHSNLNPNTVVWNVRVFVSSNNLVYFILFLIRYL
jgi:hypothetical protein